MEAAATLAERVMAAHPPATNFTVNFKETLDHIMYNTNHVDVLELLELPHETHLRAETALPSSVFPSDHIRIQTKLRLSIVKPAKDYCFEQELVSSIPDEKLGPIQI